MTHGVGINNGAPDYKVATLQIAQRPNTIG